MKNILIIVCCLFALSCKQSQKNNAGQLKGKWVIAEMPDSDMSEAELKEVVGKATLEFLEDGRYNAVDESGTENGKYTYNADSETLTLISPDKDTSSMKIRISKSKLTIDSKDGRAILKRAE